MAVRILLITILLCSLTLAAPPWLHTDGPRIVNDTGAPVTLRGVNLGGWLVEEMWMMPFVTRPPEGSNATEIKDHVSLWRTIEQRLGPETMQRMRTRLREAWLTDADFDRLRDNHVNCVRLPFLCDLLDPPDDLFTWLDRAIDACAKRNIYVVLDMHGAPGRQSKDHHTGECDVNRFFFDDANVRKAEQIWAQIASRYKDRPEVAGYDLLNEPMGAPDNDTLYAVQDRLYRAIRAVDEKHLIFIEDGYKGLDQMPDPRTRGWRNTVLSLHSYKFDAQGPQDQYDHIEQATSAIKQWQSNMPVPFYLGEFNTPHGDAQTLATFISVCDANGWSWTMWCYKIALGRGGPNVWGWVCTRGRVERLDPFRDTEEDWDRKLAQFKTENMLVQDDIGAAIRGK
jgi:aryl-phospho-beta-D-glucosidase BglC (GH1 family)